MTFKAVFFKSGYCLAAISLALLFLGLTGCATKQDVMQVDENVRQLRNDQKLLKIKLDQIDSLMASGADEDVQMRADIRTSLDEMNRQLLQMGNQLNDMQQIVYSLTQRASMEPVTQQMPATESPADSAGPADTASVAAASSVDCRKLWDNAFKDMYRSQFDLAISGFMDYLKFCPNTDLADNSQYWIAESYYEMKQHEQAIDEYKKLLDNYPDSEKRASAYFKLGRTYEKLADSAKACEYFQILEDEYPGSVEYEQVKDKLEDCRKTEGN